ncbi:DNA mismatch repair protein MutS [Paenibacillus sediminis]|uniref:DsDNA-specific endonuclease/ATPase MutS2 n=1 Tax=Paenibacillus sediminis TaxID=664909 RepID=A0ABS4H7K3_9BACL|nr:DNA mismatch repair protein MutS [Paenibacillus sediminis]MBP1938050.1 dsDNA-specific endonuclease/ATPase MutS2 [Paenibacillus sediminis]
MNLFNVHMLEYDKMKEQLLTYAVSYAGKEKINELLPSDQLNVIERALAETAEAKALLERGSSVPLPSLEGIDFVISLLGTGYMFTEQHLMFIHTFLNSCDQLRKYMASKADIAPSISSYAASLQDVSKLKSEIERCIRFGSIDDAASKSLEKVRKKISVTKERLNKKIDAIMSKHRSILQENIVSMRGGRYVIPLKREYYKQLKGTVLDQSTSGQTVYVEPQEISSLQAEFELLHAEEAREEALVLSYLTGLVETDATALRLNIEVTATYDFIFAKAKYAQVIGGQLVQLNHRGIINMIQAKHPMLLKTMIPINLHAGGPYRSLIITGPNTGGKTVVLKTLGLLTLMVQSGLLVPVEAGSTFAVFSQVMSVIGDGQSIEQSLSTFSAQIQSIKHMLGSAHASTLLLIDELAAGTDPGEGIALSIAVLEELNRKGASVMVTTHFNELKTFASRTLGFENARMEFDPHTLQPLYQLTIGEAGKSYALEIAKKLGITSSVIERSQQILNEQKKGDVIDWDKGALTKVDELISNTNATSSQKDNNTGQTSLVNVGDTKTNSKSSDSAQLEEDQAQKPRSLQVGDSVYVTSLGRTGIVYETADKMGMVGVMVQKQKFKVNQKRLKLFIEKSELYPEDYDFDIIFETKEDRKKKKLMQRKHVEGLTIVRKSEE